MATNQQRVLLLAFGQPLPVDLLQQAAGTVPAAHRQDNLVGTLKVGKGVNVVQSLRLGSGKSLLAAGYNCLILHLMPVVQ